jgi:hypothetical protein
MKMDTGQIIVSPAFTIRGLGKATPTFVEGGIMSIEANKATVRRLYDEFLERRKLEVAENDWSCSDRIVYTLQ